MSKVSLYAFKSQFGGQSAFVDHKTAATMAGYDATMPGKEPPPVSRVVVDLPDDALWIGDTITAEVLIGQRSDDEGFDDGGRWVDVVGYTYPTRGVHMAEDGEIVAILGDIRELGSDTVLAVLNMLHPGGPHAAVRNLKVMRRRTAAEDGSL